MICFFGSILLGSGRLGVHDDPTAQSQQPCLVQCAVERGTFRPLSFVWRSSSPGRHATISLQNPFALTILAVVRPPSLQSRFAPTILAIPFCAHHICNPVCIILADLGYLPGQWACSSGCACNPCARRIDDLYDLFPLQFMI